MVHFRGFESFSAFKALIKTNWVCQFEQLFRINGLVVISGAEWWSEWNLIHAQQQQNLSIRKIWKSINILSKRQAYLDQLDNWIASIEFTHTNREVWKHRKGKYPAKNIMDTSNLFKKHTFADFQAPIPLSKDFD